MSRLEPFDPGTVPLTGSRLIEAGAGTGKTFAIVSLYLRLLLERRLDVSEILVVTYTVAATSELHGRIRERLVGLARDLAQDLAQDFARDFESEEAAGPDADLIRDRVAAGTAAEDRVRVLEAIRSFDRAAIFTIHGYCQRVLAEHAFESGSAFESELVSDQGTLVGELAADFYVRELHDASPLFVHWLERDELDRLLVLAYRVASRPDVAVVPERPQSPDLVSLEAAWREAVEAVGECWQARRDEILAVLRDAHSRNAIQRNSYRKPGLETTWPPKLDDLVREPAPGIDKRFPAFERFTTRFLVAHPGKAGPPPNDRFFDLCETLLDADRGLIEGLESRRMELEHDFVDYARQELSERKRQQGVLFFDDLLAELRSALETEGGAALARALRRRHPVALIDEFQDTDPVQYAIFRRIWNGGDAGSQEPPGLFLIGDPKQAIYGFRGADVRTYLRAAHDADARYGLATNRRSDPGLVEALNVAFARPEAPFGGDGIDFEPVVTPEGAADHLRGDRIASGLRVLFASRGDGDKPWAASAKHSLTRSVAGEVARVLGSDCKIDGRPIEPGDIAVLTRSNAQARDLQAALRTYGVAAVLQSEESVFAADEAGELERVMRAMAEPDHPARLHAALATTLLSTSSDDLHGLLEEDSAAWEVWSTRFRVCRRRWAERGFVQSLRFLWLHAGVGPRLLARGDGERRLTNLLHVIELLHRASVEERLGPMGLVHWLGRHRAESREQRRWVAEDAQLRLESDDRAVQLVTVHRSKGLEYPVTLCPNLWEGRLLLRRELFPRFHDPETGASAIDLAKAPGDSDSRSLAELESFAENLRLLYVALTRARHHCTVVWGAFDGKTGTSPLGHLLHPTAGPDGELPDPKRFAPERRDDASLRAELDDLAALAPGRIEIADLDASPAPLPSPVSLPSPAPGSAGSAEPAMTQRMTLLHRSAKRSFARTWRVSSFSGLVSRSPEQQAPERQAPEVEEGRDYDATALLEAPAHAEGAQGVEAAGPSARVRLADFPAGAGPGILVHAIFEKLDFTQADGPALLERVGAALAAHGLPQANLELLAAAVRDVLGTPLDPGVDASRLALLAPEQRIDEMPFMLPVASSLTPERLAAVFERHATDPTTRRYAERAASLAFPPLAGHLRGFIDLVFRRGERWYVVDYKSNHLGPVASDYARPALERAMLEHDYVLQYHLYLVALHRHLRLRLPGYDCDRHLGGTYYLFVRGMCERYAPGCGVLHDRPPRELIEALSGLLGDER